MNIYISQDLFTHSELNWFWDHYDPKNNTMFESIDILTPEGCRFMAKPRREWVDDYFENYPYYEFRDPIKYWSREKEYRTFKPDWVQAPARLGRDIFMFGYMRLFQQYTLTLPPYDDNMSEEENDIQTRYIFTSFLDYCPYIKPEIRPLVLKRIFRSHGGFREIAKVIQNSYLNKPLNY